MNDRAAAWWSAVWVVFGVIAITGAVAIIFMLGDDDAPAGSAPAIAVHPSTAPAPSTLAPAAVATSTTTAPSTTSGTTAAPVTMMTTTLPAPPVTTEALAPVTTPAPICPNGEPAKNGYCPYSPPPTRAPLPPVNIRIDPNGGPPVFVVWETCDAMRADGYAPLAAGTMGYLPELDRNGNGFACEDGE